MGIDTSCDDTCVSVVASNGQIIANFRHTSLYREHGGVVPHLAKRQHARHLPTLIKRALQASGLQSAKELEGIAVTVGPGLGPCLGVGFRGARAICAQNNVPLIPINHIEAHALAARICSDPLHILENLANASTGHTSEDVTLDISKSFPLTPIQELNEDNIEIKPRILTKPFVEPELVQFPFLALIVSGGHTLLAHFSGLGDIERIGSSRDDACGEAFDKIARLVKIADGGRGLEQVAALGNQDRFALPVPYKKVFGFDFSFSGLKSATRRTYERIQAEKFYFLSLQEKEKLEELAYEKGKDLVRKNAYIGRKHLPEARDMIELDHQTVADLAACFQKSSLEHLTDRLSNSINWCQKNRPLTKTVVICGGVASNEVLKAKAKKVCSDFEWKLIVPPSELCVDNAVMIAWAAIEYVKNGIPLQCEHDIEPRMLLGRPLNEEMT
eukprot:c5585_g1_i2.p1 GENE.c5585_g1_i2~~c5585_g1_i2.p1  ORF type:complete len:480 (-),score=225.04 c5585_g1_i2:66-1394(-)